MYRFLRWTLSFCYAAALYVVTNQTLHGSGIYFSDWPAMTRTLAVWLVSLTATYAVLMWLVFLFQKGAKPLGP